MSGMILHHNLIYNTPNSKFYSGDSSSRENKQVSGDVTAIIAHSFQKDSSVVKTLITMDEIETVIPKILSSDATIWFHISNADVLLEIMKYAPIDESVVPIFTDNTFRARCKITEDKAIVASLISLCFHNDTICGKKLVVYQSDKLVISHEKPILTTLKSSFMKPQDYENFSIDGSNIGILDPSLYSVNAIISATGDYPDYDAASVDWKDRISGLVLSQMMKRCLLPEIIAKVRKVGSAYLFFELVYCIQTLANPVWAFIVDAQLALHNQVFVRKFPPGALEAEHLIDSSDTLSRVIELSQTVLKRYAVIAAEFHIARSNTVECLLFNIFL